MDDCGIKEKGNFGSVSDWQNDNLLKVLTQTHQDLKQLRNNINSDLQNNNFSNISHQTRQTSKNISIEYQQLKTKYNEMMVAHEQQKKEHQIALAEKDQQIQILENLLKAQYLKQAFLEANIRHLLKKNVNAIIQGSQISQSGKNSIILGVYNREEGENLRQNSQEYSNMRREDMLKQPPSPSGYTKKVSPGCRVDKLKDSIINVNRLRKHFGNDSKFKQDVLDL